MRFRYAVAALKCGDGLQPLWPADFRDLHLRSTRPSWKVMPESLKATSVFFRYPCFRDCVEEERFECYCWCVRPRPQV